MPTRGVRAVGCPGPCAICVCRSATVACRSLKRRADLARERLQHGAPGARRPPRASRLGARRLGGARVIERRLAAVRRGCSASPVPGFLRPRPPRVPRRRFAGAPRRGVGVFRRRGLRAMSAAAPAHRPARRRPRRPSRGAAGASARARRHASRRRLAAAGVRRGSGCRRRAARGGAVASLVSRPPWCAAPEPLLPRRPCVSLCVVFPKNLTKLMLLLRTPARCIAQRPASRHR